MSNTSYKGKRPCRKCGKDTRSHVSVKPMEVVTTCLDCGDSRVNKRFFFPAPIVYRDGLEWL